MTVQDRAQSEMSVQDYIALVNRYMDRGMTDGWPVIPASQDAVMAMITTLGRAPDEVLGRYQLREQPVTIKDVAVQAVMAGCLPEYFPVLVAAVEIFMPEAAMTAHSAGWVPWIVVNGPIRGRIGINCRGNVFGPGNRANATIGRAFRLTLINLAGARTNLWDKSTQGSAYKYGLCIGEDEEHSPWPGQHTDLGYEAEDSVVTGFCDSRHPRHVSQTMSLEPDHVLGPLAEELSTITHWVNPSKPDNWRTAPMPPPRGDQQGQRLVVVLSETHRKALADAGWDKSRVRQFLFDRVGRRIGAIRAGDISGWGRFPHSAGDDEWTRLASRTEDFIVISSGGVGGHSMAGLGNRFDHRKITLPKEAGPVEINSPAASHIATINAIIARGESDGLPVIPPTDDGVTAMVAAARRPAEDVLGRVEGSRATATVRDLARSALMAGCLPDYMPALTAAFELVLESAEQYCGDEGWTPWIIFNGPIRSKLGINSATNVFGPSIRANATIGRAVRLALINLGIRPGALDRSTLGQAYQYTCGVIGEHEEDSPWAPIHTEFGFAAGDSTVMVLVAAHARQTPNHEAGTAEAMLKTIADDLGTIQNYDLSFGALGTMRAVVGIGSEARAAIEHQGWTRRRAQEFLMEQVARKASDVWRNGYDGGRLDPSLSDAQRVSLVSRPEDLLVMRTGGGGTSNMTCRILEAPRLRQLDDSGHAV